MEIEPIEDIEVWQLTRELTRKNSERSLTQNPER